MRPMPSHTLPTGSRDMRPSACRKGLLRRGVLGLCLALTLCLAACLENPLPGGVVATVNGQPIALRTLETMLDTRTAGFGAFDTPSLATLHQQYGKALLSLIGQTLVMQELQRRGMGVSDEALAQAEQAVRADYTEEEFEKSFVENAIDMDAWRELMRRRIAMERFVSQVLRPTIHIPLPEIQAYYEANKAGFNVPRTAVIAQLQSNDRAALERLQATVPPPEEAPGVNIYHSRVPFDAIPAEWQKALRELKPGEYAPVRGKAGLFETVWLKEVAPQRQMTLLEAYPYIEQILMEEKLETVFQQWLCTAVEGAQIRVSVHLAAQVRGETQ